MQIISSGGRLYFGKYFCSGKIAGPKAARTNQFPGTIRQLQTTALSRKPRAWFCGVCRPYCGGGIVGITFIGRRIKCIIGAAAGKDNVLPAPGMGVKKTTGITNWC